jgi:hypothetical protein
VRKFKLIFVSVLATLLISESAFAAVKVEVKVPDFTINYVNPGDQVNTGLLVGNSLLISSTIENSATLSASAYLTSYSFDGQKQWELQIPGDSVASAINRDSTGSIYLLGAVPTLTTPAPVPAQTPVTINPDNVQVDPVTSPTNTLNSLAVWKISSTGTLLQTFTLPINEGVNPLTLTSTSTGFSIGATTAKKYLQVNVDTNGVFGAQNFPKPPKVMDLAQDFKYGKEKLKFLPTAKALIGIPTWKPKKPTPVLIQYNKLGAKRAVSSFQGIPQFVFYKSSIGVIVGSELTSGFGVSIVKPLN